MLELQKNQYDLLGPKVVESLQKRQFEAYYCSSKEDAISKVFSLIPTTDTVSWGGTMTVDQLGIKSLLDQKGYKTINRDNAKTPEEKFDLQRQILCCDTFLMSSNAITQDGELFNIDGMGNRLAALIFGPKSVIIIAGMNKVVKTMNDAYSRVRNYAAPVNALRFCTETPCSINGKCGDCLSPQTICSQFVETRFCKPAQRIKVILIGEDLGI